MDWIHVVAGAIADESGRFLLTRRPEHTHQGGLWEFPGGKLEPGEDPATGLGRELDEEVGITIRGARPLIRIHHDYGDRHILLDVYRITDYIGTPFGREGQPLDWLHPAEMDFGVFPAADRPVINALRLPELYLITGEDPRRPRDFAARLDLALARGPGIVQLRTPGLQGDAYARLAEDAFRRCDAAGARLILNTDPIAATALPCHGVHLSSSRLWSDGLRDQLANRSHMLVGASCHTRADLVRASQLGMDYALLSPVRPTLSHPDAVPLGWDGFAALIESASLPVYALGGLGADDLESAYQYGAQGIAAIRSLWD